MKRIEFSEPISVSGTNAKFSPLGKYLAFVYANKVKLTIFRKLNMREAKFRVKIRLLFFAHALKVIQIFTRNLFSRYLLRYANHFYQHF
jgi:hypothetical protein